MQIKEIISEVRAPQPNPTVGQDARRIVLEDLPSVELDRLVERVVETVLARLAQRWQE